MDDMAGTRRGRRMEGELVVLHSGHFAGPEPESPADRLPEA